MKTSLGNKTILCLAALLAFVALVPVCHARSARNDEKQARKIQTKLSKYQPGSYVHLYFRDKTDSIGALGALSDTSFAFINSDSNAKETHLYSDVSRVEKGKETIGEGSTPKHHIHIF